MTTSKQIKANLRNSKKSTGPKSEAGKVRSSVNALQHGALSDATPASNENSSPYYDYLGGLRREYCPQTVQESQLVERIAMMLWREVRLARWEASMMERGSSVVERFVIGYRPLEKAEIEAFRDGMLPIEQQLKVGRYQTSLSNQLRTLFADLDELVAARDQKLTDDEAEDAEWTDVLETDAEAE